jgi:hypothetical protein
MTARHAPLGGVVEGSSTDRASLFGNVCCFDQLHPKAS